MQAVIDTTQLNQPSPAAPQATAPSELVDSAPAAPDNGTTHPVELERSPNDYFGHHLLLALPASLLIVFLAGTIGTAFLTDTLVAAAGIGACLAFWLGGGFGFLIAGIRWGLHLEAADHKPNLPARS